MKKWKMLKINKSKENKNNLEKMSKAKRKKPVKILPGSNYLREYKKSILMSKLNVLVVAMAVAVAGLQQCENFFT